MCPPKEVSWLAGDYVNFDLTVVFPDLVFICYSYSV